MDWQASLAEERLQNTGKITVVVQDGGSIHVSKLTQTKFERWSAQGLYIFLLPRASVQ